MRAEQMEQPRNLRFKTFLLQRRRRACHVRYTGYRQILIPDYKKSTYIRCLLEFEGKYIPVIDPNMWFRGEATQPTSSACILIVEHSFEYQKLRTGIIISDVHEVVDLAAGNFKSKTNKPSFNMYFILQIPKKVNMNRLLSDSHLELLSLERQKQADEDFAAFEKKHRGYSAPAHLPASAPVDQHI